MDETHCHFCGNIDFEERHVEYVYRRKGDYMVVRDVPCTVCLHCGERYYDGNVLLNIERRFKAIYEDHVQPTTSMMVPVVVYA